MPDVVLPGAIPLAVLGMEDLPVNIDLKIYQGDYRVWYFELNDKDSNVIDLSNLTPKCQFKTTYNDQLPITLNTTIENNKIRLELTSENSNLLTADAYIYDIQLTDSAGRVKTYITGDINIYSQVTK